jgi:hypothetical protein
VNITQDRLREVLSYSPEYGIFRWKSDRRAGRDGRILICKAGEIAGTKSRDSNTPYIDIGIDYKRFLGHRLAWLYVYGEPVPSTLDHIDRNGLNNSICNLRPCTISQNGINTKIYKSNKSGVRGVSWSINCGRWQVKIAFQGKQIHLGFFDDLEMAKAVRESKAIELFGEFAEVA